MKNEAKERPVGTGCCCECREKTWLEIVAERVTDPHEREIIIKEYARMQTRIDEVKHQLEEEHNFNQGLCLEVSRLSSFLKNVECREADSRSDLQNRWFKEYLEREVNDIIERNKK